MSISLIDPALLEPEVEDPRYAGSPFRALKTLHAKQKGARYEKITECVLRAKGHTVEKPDSTDYDRKVDGQRVEIKGSCLGKGGDNFSFLQIRPDQIYDKIMFTMFYPDRLVIMEMTKTQVLARIADGTFKKQHGGNKGNSRTYLYYGNADTLATLGAKVIVE